MIRAITCRLAGKNTFSMMFKIYRTMHGSRKSPSPHQSEQAFRPVDARPSFDPVYQRPVEAIVPASVVPQIHDQPPHVIHIEVAEGGREHIGEPAMLVIAHAVVFQRGYQVISWKAHPCQIARPAVKGAGLAGADGRDPVAGIGTSGRQGWQRYLPYRTAHFDVTDHLRWVITEPECIQQLRPIHQLRGYLQATPAILPAHQRQHRLQECLFRLPRQAAVRAPPPAPPTRGRQRGRAARRGTSTGLSAVSSEGP